MSAEVQTPLPPNVPDHELIARIGAGAYGEVWLARSALGTERAVKVVHRANFTHAKPFDREFTGIEHYEPLSRQHEALVDVLQVGRDDSAGWFYYVMELADPAHPGSAEYLPQTLKELLRTRGRLLVGEVAALGVRIAEGLAFLHAHGLVHRDLKPSNIIFVDGAPKLADVGLVSTIGAELSFVGTEGYIAPEGPGSPAADVFALGLVL
jgi:eukaryotic-like serine/threonine-protein kinase